RYEPPPGPDMKATAGASFAELSISRPAQRTRAPAGTGTRAPLAATGSAAASARPAGTTGSGGPGGKGSISWSLLSRARHPGRGRQDSKALPPKANPTVPEAA